MKSGREDLGPAALARNYLQGCLLLLVAESPGHGYELLDHLPDLGLDHVDSSALYRALRRLNDQGLVESWWEESANGPARRTYRLTPEGAGFLGDTARTVAATSGHLRRFLARHRQVSWTGHGGDVRSRDAGAA